MKYCIDEASLLKRSLYIRGWCFSENSTETINIDIITKNGTYKKIDYTLQNSEDVVSVYGVKADQSRFHVYFILENEQIGDDIKIEFYTKLGETAIYDLRNLINTKCVSRTSQILSQVAINGVGLEIGPLDNPIAPKRAGFNIQTMDHMRKEDLKEKYSNDTNVNTDNIEEVDFIWDGRRYSEITGKTNYYDYILASHLIEHTTDLIGFFQECEEILNESGVLSLAIPDKRYCFDYFRPITSLSSIIDNHLLGNKTHSPGTVAEYFLYASLNSGKIGWTEKSKKEFTLCHSAEDAKKFMYNVIENNIFYDVHQWVFTPNSFRLILKDLQDLGFTNLREIAFHDTIGNEFFITLSKNGGNMENSSRLQLLKEVCI